MIQQTPLTYWLQFIILAQPLFWMNLIKWDWIQFKRGIRNTFYQTGLISLVIVYTKEIQLGFYSTSVIMQYIVLVMIAFYFYDKRYSIKEAVCLAFLTVWLNSFYWELPLHINEMLSVGFHVGMLVQFTRLLPLMYFIPNYHIGKDGKRLLLFGFGYSGLTMIIKLWRLLPWRVLKLIYIPDRFLCLLILVKVIIDAEKRIE